MSAKASVNGVSDARASHLVKQAHRDMNAIRRQDAERIEAVCAALRAAPGIPDEAKARYAKVILTHPGKAMP
jgi:hypothetical protein